MIRLILLVTAMTTLVHRAVPAEPADKPAASVAKSQPAKPLADVATAVAYDRRTDLAKLPRPVTEMIDAINVAVNSGDIEDLRIAIDWNELPPAFSPEPIDEPITFLKQESADKAGRQMLAILGNLLSVGPARRNLGRDPENSTVYVWPYLAERPLDKLMPEEEVDLYRLVPSDVIDAMRAAGRWTWYRVVIGADGTWHAFMRHD
jgi:hypothetical protein